ncbi:glycosyltransferase family 4 protein [Undibacterium sp. TJN25]|uniref:glycosyltransferase family 4 protein n=1 Tax=Undibacterium sp. TJN25 TaxID=3413056 RepID=UPI003BF1BDDB
MSPSTSTRTTLPLKVLLVSTSYPKSEKDWQGRFIADMVQALDALPELQLSVWSPPGEFPARVRYAASAAESERLSKMTALGGIAQILRNKKLAGLSHVAGLLLGLRRVYREKSIADVVHVNWLQNALPLWGNQTPALITILGTDFSLLQAPGMITLLRMVIRQRKCIMAPNAAWMVPKLQAVFGDIAEIKAIPFGVEKKWFNLSRKIEQGPPQKWLAVTRLTNKKIGNLLTWGEGLFNGARELHLFGPMQETIELPSWVKYHGPTNPTELQQTWFPEAAGLITLSRHDEGRPQVLLEAMAAGLPVIASDLPAHKDLIEHQKTGWIATSRASLQSALEHLDSIENNVSIGKSAQAWIAKEVGTWDDCGMRYKLAYMDLAKA